MYNIKEVDDGKKDWIVSDEYGDLITINHKLYESMGLKYEDFSLENVVRVMKYQAMIFDLMIQLEKE